MYRFVVPCINTYVRTLFLPGTWNTWNTPPLTCWNAVPSRSDPGTPSWNAPRASRESHPSTTPAGETLDALPGRGYLGAMDTNEPTPQEPDTLLDIRWSRKHAAFVGTFRTADGEHDYDHIFHSAREALATATYYGFAAP